MKGRDKKAGKKIGDARAEHKIKEQLEKALEETSKEYMEKKIRKYQVDYALDHPRTEEEEEQIRKLQLEYALEQTSKKIEEQEREQKLEKALQETAQRSEEEELRELEKAIEDTAKKNIENEKIEEALEDAEARLRESRDSFVGFVNENKNKSVGGSKRAIGDENKAEQNTFKKADRKLTPPGQQLLGSNRASLFSKKSEKPKSETVEEKNKSTWKRGQNWKSGKKPG